MATRGTYQFWSKHNPVITVYLHHDNYPRGAAVHLFNEETDTYVRSVEEFIRINPLAKITEDHSVHGDTEYRYDVFFAHRAGGEHRENMIMAFQRNFPKADLEESWETIVNTTMDAFIDEHIAPNIDPFEAERQHGGKG